MIPEKAKNSPRTTHTHPRARSPTTQNLPECNHLRASFSRHIPPSSPPYAHTHPVGVHHPLKHRTQALLQGLVSHRFRFFMLCRSRAPGTTLRARVCDSWFKLVQAGLSQAKPAGRRQVSVARGSRDGMCVTGWDGCSARSTLPSVLFLLDAAGLRRRGSAKRQGIGQAPGAAGTTCCVDVCPSPTMMMPAYCFAENRGIVCIN